MPVKEFFISIFGEDMDKSLVACFLTRGVAVVVISAAVIVIQ